MPLLLDQDYVNLKNQIIKAERRVLKELGFCVHVKHPHKVRTRPAAPEPPGRPSPRLTALESSECAPGVRARCVSKV